jgi:hypothetical protein
MPSRFVSIGVNQKKISGYIQNNFTLELVKKAMRLGLEDSFHIDLFSYNNFSWSMIEECAQNNINNIFLLKVYFDFHKTMSMKELKKYLDIGPNFGISNQDLSYFIENQIPASVVEKHLSYKAKKN